MLYTCLPYVHCTEQLTLNSTLHCILNYTVYIVLDSLLRNVWRSMFSSVHIILFNTIDMSQRRKCPSPPFLSATLMFVYSIMYCTVQSILNSIVYSTMYRTVFSIFWRRKGGYFCLENTPTTLKSLSNVMYNV